MSKAPPCPEYVSVPRVRSTCPSPVSGYGPRARTTIGVAITLRSRPRESICPACCCPLLRHDCRISLISWSGIVSIRGYPFANLKPKSFSAAEFAMRTFPSRLVINTPSTIVESMAASIFRSVESVPIVCLILCAISLKACASSADSSLVPT
ncbi:MAG: hypothetical protein DDT27_01351 [Dehalococcoidia bacterium]|nr:hypothetical protein [Chloroflexota bacterium]